MSKTDSDCQFNAVCDREECTFICDCLGCTVECIWESDNCPRDDKE